jgi:hypothetical protein
MRTPHKIRPLTDQDILEEYGFESPFPYEGLIMEDMSGTVLGLMGVWDGDGIRATFSRIRDEGRKYPVNILKMAEAVRELLGNYEENVYAIASKTEKNAGGFLEHIGFRFAATTDQGDMYVWENNNGHDR